MFYVGQKVVCVDDQCRVLLRPKGWRGWMRPWFTLDHNLNSGDIYVVTAVQSIQTVEGPKGAICVDRARHFKHPDIGFPFCQFRPLVERKTDISIFTRMLTPNKQTEKV